MNVVRKEKYLLLILAKAAQLMIYKWEQLKKRIIKHSIVSICYFIERLTITVLR